MQKLFTLAQCSHKLEVSHKLEASPKLEASRGCSASIKGGFADILARTQPSRQMAKGWDLETGIILIVGYSWV